MKTLNHKIEYDLKKLPEPIADNYYEKIKDAWYKYSAYMSAGDFVLKCRENGVKMNIKKLINP